MFKLKKGKAALLAVATAAFVAAIAYDKTVNKKSEEETDNEEESEGVLVEINRD
ncbi:MAG: hypothetical protein ACRDD2_02515 [Sarcina sp.]